MLVSKQAAVRNKVHVTEPHFLYDLCESLIIHVAMFFVLSVHEKLPPHTRSHPTSLATLGEQKQILPQNAQTKL
jgi:hypothetical protein